MILIVPLYPNEVNILNELKLWLSSILCSLYVKYLCLYHVTANQMLYCPIYFRPLPLLPPAFFFPPIFTPSSLSISSSDTDSFISTECSWH